MFGAAIQGELAGVVGRVGRIKGWSDWPIFTSPPSASYVKVRNGIPQRLSFRTGPGPGLLCHFGQCRPFWRAGYHPKRRAIAPDSADNGKAR